MKLTSKKGLTKVFSRMLELTLLKHDMRQACQSNDCERFQKEFLGIRVYLKLQQNSEMTHLLKHLDKIDARFQDISRENLNQSRRIENLENSLKSLQRFNSNLTNQLNRERKMFQFKLEKQATERTDAALRQLTLQQQDKFEKLNSQLKYKKQIIKQLQKQQFLTLTSRKESNKLKTLGNCVYTQTKTQEVTVLTKFFNLNDILQSPTQFIFSSIKQSLRKVNHITNTILEEKILSDLGNFHNKLPNECLQDYVSNWFLRRYGSYVVSEPYLKEYIQSVRKLAFYTPRFQIIAKHTQKIKQSIQNSTQIQKYSPPHSITRRRMYKSGKATAAQRTRLVARSVRNNFLVFLLNPNFSSNPKLQQYSKGVSIKVSKKNSIKAKTYALHSQEIKICSSIVYFAFWINPLS